MKRTIIFALSFFVLFGCKPDMPETTFKTTIKVVDFETGKPISGALVLVGARISVEPEFEPPYNASMAGSRAFTNKEGKAKFKFVKGLYEGAKPKDALWKAIESRKPKVERKILGVESGSILVFAPGYGFFHQPFGVIDNPGFVEYLRERNETSQEFSGWFGRGFNADEYNFKAIMLKAEDIKNNREIVIKAGKVINTNIEHKFASFLPELLGYADITASKDSGTTEQEKIDIYAFFKEQLEYAVKSSTEAIYREGLEDISQESFIKAFIAWKPDTEQQNHEKYIHEWLTQKAIENLSPEYEEIKQYASIIQEGVKEEDRDLRYLNHFYNPDSPETALTAKSETALKWGAIGYPNNPTNEWDFEDAKTYYRQNDKTKAYKALGHVIHLLEDLSAPMHTRHIQHFKYNEAGMFETYFESQLKKNANNLPMEYYDVDTTDSKTDIKEQFEETAKLTFGQFTKDNQIVNFDDYYAVGKLNKNPDNQTLELMGKYLFPKTIQQTTQLMKNFYYQANNNLYAQAGANTQKTEKVKNTTDSTGAVKKDYRIETEKDQEGRPLKIKFISPEDKVIKTLSPDEVIIAGYGKSVIHKFGYHESPDYDYEEYERKLLNAKGEVKWQKTWKNYPEYGVDLEAGFSGWFEGIAGNGERSYVTYRSTNGVYNLVVLNEDGKEIAKTNYPEMLYLPEISPDGKIIGANTVKDGYEYLFFLEVDTGKIKLVKTHGTGWQGGFILSSGGPLINGKILLWFEEINKPKSYRRVYIEFNDLPDDMGELIEKGGEKK